LEERGIEVSYETVRRWVNHFGPKIAADPSIGRAEALRRSILAMIDGAAETSEEAHPFFWAPFILAGEGGPER